MAKLSYMIQFGIATRLRMLFLEKLLFKSKFYTVCFDESLNEVVQKCQMDFSLNFDSKFLGHASSQDLLEEFQQALKDLHESSMLQVSVDGPNVNWAFYDELRKHHEREELPSLINIGSCDLHIVHRALKTCVTATEWNLKGILYLTS